mmetsp:Transcript_25941/g.53594  ORF Transcript_25941/g.53594 Transcript_25941/m.53594 type:complete len:341 (-) Transcript_25941:70-1092(-)
MNTCWYTPAVEMLAMTCCFLALALSTAEEVFVGRGNHAYVTVQPGSAWAVKRLKDPSCAQSDGSTACAIRLRRERDILRWLHSRGYPVPRVPEGMAATLSEGPTRSPSEVPPRLEMELVDGATMAKHLSSHVANRTYVRQAAQTLARLHRELHMITGAPIAWRYPTHQSKDIRKFDRGMNQKGEVRLLHFDLNPTHVMIPASGRKPVVIDWDGAFAGNLTESFIDSANAAVKMITAPSVVFGYNIPLGSNITELRAKGEQFVVDFIRSFPSDESAAIMHQVSTAAQLQIAARLRSSTLPSGSGKLKFQTPEESTGLRHLRRIASTGSLFIGCNACGVVWL